MGMKASWGKFPPNMALGLEVAAAHSEYLTRHPLGTGPVLPQATPQAPLVLVHSRSRDERAEEETAA